MMTIQANELNNDVGSSSNYGSGFDTPFVPDYYAIKQSRSGIVAFDEGSKYGEYKNPIPDFKPYKIDTSAETKETKDLRKTVLANQVRDDRNYFYGFSKQETLIGAGIIVIILFYIWK